MNQKDVIAAMQKEARFQVLHANEIVEPRTGAEGDFIDFIRSNRHTLGYARMMQIVAAEWCRKSPGGAFICGPPAGDLIDIEKEKVAEAKTQPKS